MKKRLATLICVMLFLCQNSLYVTAEAASAIRTENKKTTKEQETSSENDEEQDVLWIPAVYQGINTKFGTYYAYETNLIFEISDEEKNLIATDLMCEYMNGRYYLIYDDKVLYYSVEADGMHKIMAYDEKTGMIKEIYSEPYKDSAAEDLVTPNYLYLLGKYSDYLVFMDQSYEQNLRIPCDFESQRQRRNKSKKFLLYGRSIYSGSLR